MLPDGAGLMGRALVQFTEAAPEAELGHVQFSRGTADLRRFPAALCLDVNLSLDAPLLDDEQSFARLVGEIDFPFDVDPSFLHPGDWNVITAGDDLGKEICSFDEPLVFAVVRIDHANVRLWPVVAGSEFDPRSLYGHTGGVMQIEGAVQ